MVLTFPVWGENMTEQESFEAVLRSFADSAIRDRTYYPAFRRGWEALFRRVLDEGKSYLDPSSDACYSVKHSFLGIDTVFHFDQTKLADWYAKEQARGKRVVFTPQRFRHIGEGRLEYHDSICRYEPAAPEPTLQEDARNILAAALPSLPPELAVVYGNKWVDSRFNAFFNRRISLFLIGTDYVPAFLASDFEICLYLFMMDYCIIKENYQKVRDEELSQFLHILRPSPMLKIKGLL